MTNLIAPDDKRHLLRDYRQRRLVVVGYLSFLLWLIVLVLLVSFYFVASYRLSSLRKALQAETSLQSAQTSALEGQSVGEINEKLAMFKTVDQLADTPPATLIMRHLASARPTGIRVSSVDYSLSPDNSAGLTVRGTTATRKALVNYIDKLKLDPLFIKVESPVANLIQDSRSSFQITLSAAASLNALRQKTK